MTKIKVNRSIVDSKGNITKSNDTFDMELPIKSCLSSKVGGFWMAPNGKGSYNGPNQMFGGPKGGELVLFDNVNGRQYYGLITSMTQGWHSRECKVEFLCFRNEIGSICLDGLKREFLENTITEKQLIDNLIYLFGFTKAFDIRIDMAKEDIKKFINNYKYESNL